MKTTVQIITNNSNLQMTITILTDLNVYCIQFLTFISITNLFLININLKKTVEHIQYFNIFQNITNRDTLFKFGNLYTFNIFLNNPQFKIDIKDMYTAIRYDNLILFDLMQKKYKDVISDYDLCAILSAKNGSLNVLKWLHNKGANIHVHNEVVVVWAAIGGHLHVLKYLYKNSNHFRFRINEAFLFATKNGYLNVVAYLFRKKLPSLIINKGLVKAAKNGHVYIIQFLHQKGGDLFYNNKKILKCASINNKLSVIEYLNKHGLHNNVLDIIYIYYCKFSNTIRTILCGLISYIYLLF